MGQHPGEPRGHARGEGRYGAVSEGVWEQGLRGAAGGQAAVPRRALLEVRRRVSSSSRPRWRVLCPWDKVPGRLPGQQPDRRRAHPVTVRQAQRPRRPAEDGAPQVPVTQLLHRGQQRPVARGLVQKAGRGSVVVRVVVVVMVQGEERRDLPVQRVVRPLVNPQPERSEAQPALHRQFAPGGGGAPAELPGGSPDEDVIAAGVQHPVVALPRVVVVPGHLDEALIEAEVVADGVLPALLVLPVVREVLHDELVDAVEREPLLGALPDGHHDQGVVAERRFVIFPVFPAVGTGTVLLLRRLGAVPLSTSVPLLVPVLLLARFLRVQSRGRGVHLRWVQRLLRVGARWGGEGPGDPGGSGTGVGSVALGGQQEALDAEGGGPVDGRRVFYILHARWLSHKTRSKQ